MPPVLPRSDANTVRTPPLDARMAVASPPPPKAPSAGHAFVGAGEVPPAPTKSPPPPPRSGTEPAVSASTLVDGGVDYADKLTALVSSNVKFKALPSEVRSAILAHVTQHPDAIAIVL